MSNQDIKRMYNDLIVRGLFEFDERDGDFYNNIVDRYYTEESMDTPEFVARIHHHILRGNKDLYN